MLFPVINFSLLNLATFIISYKTTYLHQYLFQVYRSTLVFWGLIKRTVCFLSLYKFQVDQNTNFEMLGNN